MVKVILVTWSAILGSVLIYGVIMGILNLILSSYIDV
jgi:hypothetical protein